MEANNFASGKLTAGWARCRFLAPAQVPEKGRRTYREDRQLPNHVLKPHKLLDTNQGTVLLRRGLQV